MKTVEHDNQRWQAVQKRDVQADGQFVFAVRSTGIYCRPSCPGRRYRVRLVLQDALSLTFTGL
jgi:methylphosphotriester-DNA--protein-cysteine methyltransferase